MFTSEKIDGARYHTQLPTLRLSRRNCKPFSKEKLSTARHKYSVGYAAPSQLSPSRGEGLGRGERAAADDRRRGRPAGDKILDMPSGSWYSVGQPFGCCAGHTREESIAAYLCWFDRHSPAPWGMPRDDDDQMRAVGRPRSLFEEQLTRFAEEIMPAFRGGVTG
jgi:hypothetical protein